jgi:thiosulfate reductase cytochrome b subunit
MPFISGQVFGLFAGMIIIVLYAAAYMVMKVVKGNHSNVRTKRDFKQIRYQERLSAELSEELTGDLNHKKEFNTKDHMAEKCIVKLITDIIMFGGIQAITIMLK